MRTWGLGGHRITEATVIDSPAKKIAEGQDAKEGQVANAFFSS
jgi:hypothetical protein